jgi:hypothetical protein
MANFTQAYKYATYVVPILSPQVNVASVTGLGIGTNGFISIASLLSESAKVAETDGADNYGIGAGATAALTITNAAIASGVATLTVGTNSVVVGDVIEVSGVGGAFAVLNGTWLVSGQNATTVSFLIANANVTSASAVGLVLPYAGLSLDGTDIPVKMKGLKTISLNTDTSSEEVITYDDENAGFSLKVATSKSWGFDLAGVSAFTDAGYKLMRLIEKGSVSQGLMAKLVRRGPVGSTETVFGFGRFNSFSEGNDAGSVCEWTCQFEGYGPYAINFTT